MEVTIRAYAPSDLESCRDLWRSLTQRHRDLYDDPSIGDGDPGLELDEHLARPQLAHLWVAEVEGELVGLCGLLVKGEESELEPIVVRPDWRSRGVGARLARRAIDESRRLGMRFVNVRPVARNAEAIRFFHREGFRLLGRLELCIPLDESPTASPGGALPLHGADFTF